jgi:hypothetical protein
MLAPRVTKSNVKGSASSQNTSHLHSDSHIGHRHHHGGEYLHTLQQSIGNQQVLYLLRQQGLLENTHGAQFPVSHLSGPMQMKLKVGAINDPLEHEADRSAEHVGGMPRTEGVRAPQISCKSLEREEPLQTQPTARYPPACTRCFARRGSPLMPSRWAIWSPASGRTFLACGCILTRPLLNQRRMSMLTPIR